jgi:hypothetical protein
MSRIPTQVVAGIGRNTQNVRRAPFGTPLPGAWWGEAVDGARLVVGDVPGAAPSGPAVAFEALEDADQRTPRVAARQAAVDRRTLRRLDAG